MTPYRSAERLPAPGVLAQVFVRARFSGLSLEGRASRARSTLENRYYRRYPSLSNNLCALANVSSPNTGCGVASGNADFQAVEPLSPFLCVMSKVTLDRKCLPWYHGLSVVSPTALSAMSARHVASQEPRGIIPSQITAPVSTLFANLSQPPPLSRLFAHLSKKHQGRGSARYSNHQLRPPSFDPFRTSTYTRCSL